LIRSPPLHLLRRKSRKVTAEDGITAVRRFLTSTAERTWTRAMHIKFGYPLHVCSLYEYILTDACSWCIVTWLRDVRYIIRAQFDTNEPRHRGYKTRQRRPSVSHLVFSCCVCVLEHNWAIICNGLYM